jgi:hypothetical protein
VGEIQIFIAALLASVALLNALANWWQVPYPIVLVLGGLVLGLVPGIPLLRDSGQISAEVMRRIEREIDLEEERLEV